jgi:hypothetical protein
MSKINKSEEILNTQEQFLEILANNFINHTQIIMNGAGKTLSKKEAQTILCNVGLYLMNKNKDIITNAFKQYE